MSLPSGHESDASSGAAIPYPSLVALKDAHTQLLRRHRQDGDAPPLLEEVQAFIRQGAATGSLMDGDADRHTAQSLLDYWVTVLYRARVTPPDAVLEDFDPALAPTLDEAACPYRGLAAFQEEHQDRFFGRSRLIDAMLGHMTSQPLLAVLGPSGSGKSSLVLGGLVPRLKHGGLPGSADWLYFPPLVPSSDPLRALAMAVKPASAASADWVSQQTAGFRADPNHLSTIVASLTAGPALIAVDQFEEIFTLCADDEVRQALVGNLLGLLTDTRRGHRIVVTMRTDFESQLVRLPALEKWFQSGEVRVTPLSSVELRQAIEEPARHVGLRFEDGVIDELVRDILGEPAGLPLLQFTLLRLWKGREGNRVTLKAYRALGGARRALALTADEFFKQLIFQDQETARRILLRMARPSEGLEVTSNRVLRSTLYKAGEATDQVDRVLEKLVAVGLVRLTPGETASEDQAEVAHEALIRNWPQLVGWVEDERVRLRQRLRLTAAAEQWQAHDRDQGALLRGAALDEALSYTDLNQLEGQYLEASRNAQEAARLEKEQQSQALVDAATRESEAAKRAGDAARRHARQMRAAAVVLLILAAVAGYAAYRVSQQKEEIAREVKIAHSRELASHAVGQLDIDPQLSLLLALEAANTSPTGEATAALRQAVSVVRDVKVFTGHKGNVNRALFTPDGRSVISAGRDSVVSVWSPASDAPPVSLEGHTAEVHELVISPDGRYFATEAADGTGRLWNRQTGGSQKLEGLNGRFSALDFSPDGNWLATEASPSGQGRGEVAVWSTQDAGKPAVLRGHVGQITFVKFSPDGRYLLTGDNERMLRVWSGPTWQPTKTIKAHAGTVNRVAFSRDGRRAVSAGDDGKAFVWNTATWERVATLDVGQDAVSTAAFSPDGGHVITGSRRRVSGSREASDPREVVAVSRPQDAAASIWETESGQKVADLIGHDGDVSVAAFGPNGHFAITASADGTARLWDAKTGAPTGVLRGHTGGIYSAEFNPAGNLVVTAGEDGTVRMWNASPRQVVDDIDSGEQSAARVAFGQDGTSIVTANLRGLIRRWGLTSSKETTRLALLSEWKREDLDPFDIAVSRDGTHAITGSRYARTVRSLSGDGNDVDKSARVWNLTTSALVAELPGHEDPVHHVAISDDNRFAATAGGGIGLGRNAEQRPEGFLVRVWEIGNKTPRTLKHTQQVTGIEFSADSALVVTSSDDGVARVWRVADGVEQRKLSSDGRIFHAVMSPDRQTLLTSGFDGSATLWGYNPGTASFLLKGHRGPILRGSFSADGRLALTASEDGTIRVWEVASGENVAELRGAEREPMMSAAFSPNGRWVVGGAANGKVRLMSCEPCLPMDELIVLARSRTTRQLTPQERHQYLHEEATVAAAPPRSP